ncbi:MAG: hypothetical protein ACXWV8_03860 [Chitinophagaceae bacterium]
MNVIHAVKEHLVTKDCKEWTSDIQLRVRNDGDITGDEKTIKFR